MKKKKLIVSVVLGIVLIMAGAGMVSAASGQNGSGSGQQDMTQERIQDLLLDQDQLQLQDNVQQRDQDRIQEPDRLQERDQVRDQICDLLGIPDADVTEIMNRYQEQDRLREAAKAELNAYHKLLMLEVNSNDAAKVQEMRQELNRIRLEIRARILTEYSNEELQVMEMLRNRMMNRFVGTMVLDVDSIVSVGSDMHFDTPPVIKNGRVLVPVRGVTEGFGAQVEWNAENRMVIIKQGETVLRLTLGSMDVEAGDKTVKLDVAPEIMENRVYVPLRFVSEGLGHAVEWDYERKLAVIME